MPPPYPDTFRVSCRGLLAGGEVWANIWHIKYAGPGDVLNTPALTVDIGAAFRAFYADAGVMAFRGPTWSLTEILVTNVGIVGDEARDAEVSGLTGAAGGTVLPYQLAVVMSMRTTLATRRGRGRVYLNGFQVSAVDPQVADASPIVDAGLRTAILLAGAQLEDDLAGITGAAFGLAVLSDADGVSRMVNRLRVGNRWDIQRRRDNGLDEAYSSATLTPPPEVP